ncbi:hypothetical protein HY642_04540 [Candidatus Woesearchaeota archaeon]|nr:hypothetical protein [Candidatus Woesearchaeota archaeon]
MAEPEGTFPREGITLDTILREEIARVSAVVILPNKIMPPHNVTEAAWDNVMGRLADDMLFRLRDRLPESSFPLEPYCTWAKLLSEAYSRIAAFKVGSGKHARQKYLSKALDLFVVSHARDAYFNLARQMLQRAEKLTTRGERSIMLFDLVGLTMQKSHVASEHRLNMACVRADAFLRLAELNPGLRHSLLCDAINEYHIIKKESPSPAIDSRLGKAALAAARVTSGSTSAYHSLDSILALEQCRREEAAELESWTPDEMRRRIYQHKNVYGNISAALCTFASSLNRLHGDDLRACAMMVKGIISRHMSREQIEDILTTNRFTQARRHNLNYAILLSALRYLRDEADLIHKYNQYLRTPKRELAKNRLAKGEALLTMYHAGRPFAQSNKRELAVNALDEALEHAAGNPDLEARVHARLGRLYLGEALRESDPLTTLRGLLKAAEHLRASHLLGKPCAIALSKMYSGIARCVKRLSGLNVLERGYDAESTLEGRINDLVPYTRKDMGRRRALQYQCYDEAIGRLHEVEAAGARAMTAVSRAYFAQAKIAHAQGMEDLNHSMPVGLEDICDDDALGSLSMERWKKGYDAVQRAVEKSVTAKEKIAPLFLRGEMLSWLIRQNIGDGSTQEEADAAWMEFYATITEFDAVPMAKNRVWLAKDKYVRASCITKESSTFEENVLGHLYGCSLRLLDNGQQPLPLPTTRHHLQHPDNPSKTILFMRRQCPETLYDNVRRLNEQISDLESTPASDAERRCDILKAAKLREQKIGAFRTSLAALIRLRPHLGRASLAESGVDVSRIKCYESQEDYAMLFSRAFVERAPLHPQTAKYDELVGVLAKYWYPELASMPKAMCKDFHPSNVLRDGCIIDYHMLAEMGRMTDVAVLLNPDCISDVERRLLAAEYFRQDPTIEEDRGKLWREFDYQCVYSYLLAIGNGQHKLDTCTEGMSKKARIKWWKILQFSKQTHLDTVRRILQDGQKQEYLTSKDKEAFGALYDALRKVYIRA